MPPADLHAIFTFTLTLLLWIVKAVREFIDAPGQMRAFQADVSRTKSLVHKLAQLYHNDQCENKTYSHSLSILPELIEQGRQLVEDGNRLLLKTTTLNGNRTREVRRMVWKVRYAGARELKEKMYQYYAAVSAGLACLRVPDKPSKYYKLMDMDVDFDFDCTTTVTDIESQCSTWVDSLSQLEDAVDECDALTAVSSQSDFGN